MRTRLPPLFSLQVFEAAARQGNFSRAARELHLTQSGVSRQIQLLEAWHGATLFARNGPRVQLTPAGRNLLARLSAPLNALHAAFYHDDGAQQLTINTLASSARAWLIPRLPDFQQAHPHIALNVQTDYALVLPAPQLPIVAIRHGPARVRTDDGLYSELLFDEQLLTVASPAVVNSFGTRPAGWPSAQLLRHGTLDWSIWFDACNVPRSEPASGIAFNDASVMLDAAEANLGIALTRYSLAKPRLQAKRLVQAAPELCASPSSHYFVCRTDCLALPAVQSFLQWMRAQASAWKNEVREVRGLDSL